VLIKPQPGGDLTSAAARHNSPFGAISVAWRFENDEFTMSFSVPYGVTAEVWLPGDDGAREFGAGVHELSAPWA
jgi:alpha-L-rhamnosidase